MIISPDQYLFNSQGVYEWTPSRVRGAWEKARGKYRDTLRTGVRRVFIMVGAPASGKSTWLQNHHINANLYFDACFDLPWKREPYIQWATAAGMAVECVWLNTPLEECLRRNSDRQRGEVPKEVVGAMHQKLSLNPPTLAEGFSLIQEIRR